MDRKHLKNSLSSVALSVAGKCATGAAAAAAVIAFGGFATEANAATSTTSTEAHISTGNIAVAPPQEGAILLNLVGIDAATGMIVADHYSHSSHSSHSSHYSGR